MRPALADAHGVDADDIEIVDRHAHGNGLSRVLPRSWDHPFATDRATWRVVARGSLVAGFGSIHVDRRGGPVWRFGRLM